VHDGGVAQREEGIGGELSGFQEDQEHGRARAGREGGCGGGGQVNCFAWKFDPFLLITRRSRGRGRR
jgi:hypothetical protein